MMSIEEARLRARIEGRVTPGHVRRARGCVEADGSSEPSFSASLAGC